MVYYRSVSPPDMRSLHLNRALVGILAAIFLLVALRLAFERPAPKPIPAADFVRAMQTNQTSLIARYLRENQNSNARLGDDRSLLCSPTRRRARDVARLVLAAGGSPGLSHDAG